MPTVTFAEVIKRNARDVERLQNRQAAEFLALLVAMRDKLAARIARAGGDTFTVFRMRAAIAEAEAEIEVLRRGAGKIWKAGEREAVEMAIQHTGDELDRGALKWEHKALDVTIDAAKVLADPVQQLLANHFDVSIQHYGLELLNGVRREVFTALRAGDSDAQTAKRIQWMNGPMGRVGEMRATRLVRTEISQAYGTAQETSIHQAAAKVPGLVKVWWHVGSYPCPVCVPLHGTMRPVDGTWTVKNGRKTRTITGTPAHPNCTCRTVAVKRSWVQAMGESGLLGRRTR